MRYISIIFFLSVLYCGTMLFSQEACAAKIILKSGKEITAEIIEKTDTYIKIDFKGTPIYYELKYISCIEETQKPGNDNPAVSASTADENKKLKEEILALKEILRQVNIGYNIRLGDLYAQNDCFDEAIKAYENALVFKPDDPDLEYNLGVLFETNKKDAPKAAEHYRSYLRLRPDAPDKDEINKIIGSLLNDSSF